MHAGSLWPASPDCLVRPKKKKNLPTKEKVGELDRKKMLLVFMMQLYEHVIPTHPFILASLFLSIPLLLLLCSRKRAFSKNTRLPPSPSKLPIIGNLHQLGSLPHRSIRALSEKHGPLMYLQLGQVPTIVVSSSEMAEQIMRSHDHVFASRPILKIAKKLRYGNLDMGFTPYGKYWRQVRKLSLVHLLSTKKVQSFDLVRKEEVAFMIEKVYESSSSLGVVNMSEILNSFANDMVCRVVSGKSSKEVGENNMLCELIKEATLLLGTFNVEDYFPSLAWLDAFSGLDARVQKAFEKWDDLLNEIIEDHASSFTNEGYENNDFVDVLLSLQKDPSMEFALTKENIKAIIEEMFTAGTDTSYIVLEWGMTQLVRNPKVMKKLQEEIRGIAIERSIVKEEDLSGMAYLKAVIKEILRLHPPTSMLLPRESMECIKIQGYEIPKKTRVLVNAWAIGRDPKVWDAAEEFQPERFMGSPIDFKGHDFQFIPFGAGRRVCPGMHFAVSSIELALANLVHQFDWKLPYSMTAKDLDMAEAPGITSPKKESLCLVATPCCNRNG